ncbi:MAG TPA: NfeD family protein [Phycisphaerae bacterium]
MIFGALALLLLAFLLIASELFVPSHGILTTFAAIAAMGSLWLAYRVSPGIALVVAVLLLIATPVVFYMAVKIYPSTAVGRKVLLKGPGSAVKGFQQEASQLESLIGRQGITTSLLRPSGSIEIDGQRIDAMSESDVIDAGKPVEVVQVVGLKVIVKATS